jgi:hypothetical protein
MSISTYFDFFPKRPAYPISIIRDDFSQEQTFDVSFPDFYRQVSNLSYAMNDGQYYYMRERVLDGERPDQLSLRLYGTPKYYWTFFFINEHIRLGERIQWPMSDFNLRKKIQNDFDGHALIGLKRRYIKGFLPRLLIVRDNSFIQKPFIIGEEVRGSISNASATILQLRPDYGQMIVKMISDQTSFRTREFVNGLSSNERFFVHKTVEWADAPMYYEDEDEREVTNPNFIKTDEIPTGPFSPVSFREHLFRVNEKLSMIRVLKKDSLTAFENTFRDLIRKKSSERF